MSTGWVNREKNIEPIGNFRVRNSIKKENKNGYGLIICVAMPRFSFDIRSMVTAGQMREYFKDQFKFVNALPKDIQASLRLRTYPHDYGWEQEKRWKCKFPNIKIDKYTKLLGQVDKCRLFISTYNATTYLDTFSLNLPTIIFWNPKDWEVNDYSRIFFDELEVVGIFHKDPISAAELVASIWDDIDSWWNSEQVQLARKNFCNKFCKFNSSISDDLYTLINSRIAGK